MNGVNYDINEAEELFESALIYFQHDDGGIEQSFEYFYGALELRIAHDFLNALSFTNIEILRKQQEYQKLNQNINNIYIESLLI